MKTVKKRGKAQKEALHTPCHYCLRPMLPAHHLESHDSVIRLQTISVEHITPRSKGGTNDPENLVYACTRCNSMRGSLDYDIFVMFARHVLQVYPDAQSLYLRAALQQFVTSLAEIAIRNKKEARNAMRLSLLSFGDDLRTYSRRNPTVK